MKKSFVKSAFWVAAFVVSSATAQAQALAYTAPVAEPAANETPKTTATSLVANIATSHAQHRLNTLQLTCLNKADKGVKIFIADAHGSVVFSERLNGLHSFRRTYDVSELAAGQYRLVVDNGVERTEKSIVF